MKFIPNIWALIDHKVGNSSQILGLLDNLNWPYILKEIKYNSLINIPNILKPSYLLGVNLDSSSNIAAPFPDIIISAGRRSAPLALHIKHQNPSIFLVQILKPDIGYKNFDLVIIPEHDDPTAMQNIIPSLGAMHNINSQKLQKERDLWIKKFQHLKTPYITLIVGGNSKHGNFTSDNILTLAKNVNNLAQSLSASLLITTSRRTPSILSNLLKQMITVPNFFYDFNEKDLSNPYFAMLELGEIIIVTGDSISMCSEACYPGKAVYIFAPDNILSKKHYKFFRKLTERKYANLFVEHLIPNNEVNQNFVPLNEASRIADIVKNQFFMFEENLKISDLLL